MKRLFILAATGSFMMVMLSLSWAATNLNSSRSNIYRMVYDADVVSKAQATALLAELDKIGPADEAKLKQWLPANFKTFGIPADRIKHISILSGRQITCSECVDICKGKCAKGSRGDCFCYEPITTRAHVRRVDKASPALILLLSNPADEAEALKKVSGQLDGKNNQ